MEYTFAQVSDSKFVLIIDQVFLLMSILLNVSNSKCFKISINAINFSFIIIS